MHPTTRRRTDSTTLRRRLIGIGTAIVLSGLLLGDGGAASAAATPPDDPFGAVDPQQPQPDDEPGVIVPDQPGDAERAGPDRLTQDSPDSEDAPEENQPPVTVDDHYTTPMNTPLDVEAPGILANDSDPDGSVITTYTESPIQDGGVMYRASDGSFRYEPAEGFEGTETFSYFAIDEDGAHTQGTVTIEVVRDTAAPDGDDSCPDRRDCEPTDRPDVSDHTETTPETDELAEAPPAPSRTEAPTYTG